jgi:glycosidase
MKPLVAVIIGAMLGCGKTPGNDTDTTGAEDAPWDGLCPTDFSHAPDGSPDGVAVVGEFNRWDAAATPMALGSDGVWTARVPLEPGPHAYRFVEITEWTQGQGEAYVCDPTASLAVCGESTAGETNWAQECTTGSDDCASMRAVADCSRPRITVERVEATEEVLRITGRVVAGLAPVEAIAVDLNGESVPVEQDGDVFHVEHVLGERLRHHAIVSAIDSVGRRAEPVSVPFWTDDFEWSDAIIYHALIDRVANGNPSNDATAETTHSITDWTGGDLSGLQASLPYLDDLGVNALWISNPQPAPSSAWPGTCDATYSGYHGFWPVQFDGVDPHLGGIDDLDNLIDAAHERGMRVMMDWVGNHVHTDHPAAAADTQFHPMAECNDFGRDGVSNWDRIPQECWFTSYLPDWDHSQVQVSHDVVDMARTWARDRKLDGLRVDAAKHMSTAVLYNLRSTLEAELEHEGSPFDFILIGETFDGADAINATIAPHLLHGQFDFPLYWTLRAAFVYDSASVSDAVNQAAAMASHYPNGQMSTFLGNLDVGRFLTERHESTADVCPEGTLRQAGWPDDGNAFDRLRLAWTLLFTQPGMPMIYYGDEFGLPGYGDPDNRQPLWWYGVDPTEASVAAVSSQLAAGPARVLDTVQRLAAARKAHPALRTGEQENYWIDGDGLVATAHTFGDDRAIVVLNRNDGEAWLDNSLSFFGFPEGTWVDLLTDERFESDGDRLRFGVPPASPRVLVWEP